MLAKPINGREHAAHQAGLIDIFRHQEPIAHRRCCRAHADHFGIIVDPILSGQLRPPVVEYKFSVAMGFQI